MMQITPTIMGSLLLLLLSLLALLLWKTIGSASTDMDWSDLIAEKTKDGRNAASVEKITLIIGTAIGSWAVITMAYSGKLEAPIFGLYLAFCGGVKGWSTFMKVKAAQTETPQEHRANK